MINDKKVTIASIAMNLIATRSDLTNQQIVDEIKKLKPNANTTTNSIAWYKSDMKKNKYQVVTQERTIQVIQEELQEATMLVEKLQEELQELQMSQEDEEMKQLEALAKKYNKQVV
jgi:chromosome segregation ATPase